MLRMLLLARAARFRTEMRDPETVPQIVDLAVVEADARRARSKHGAPCAAIRKNSIAHLRRTVLRMGEHLSQKG